MNKYTKAISNDMEQLADDARALMEATADATGEKVDEARKRLKVALNNGKTMLNRIEDEIISEARAAMQCVHDNPRTSIAAAVAVGAFIGCIFAFRCYRRCD
jgi:ElaB/YqjD/DUF883 family membrane-anchored ribosome-binding protein